MFPFTPFYAFVPSVLMVPVAEEWTSTLDRRTNRGPRGGKRSAIGRGESHHDFLSFSFTDDKTPAGETLVVMHPVTALHFDDLPTKKLKALLEELKYLQEARAWAMGLGVEELPARQRTIDTLAAVLRAKKDWLGDDGKKGSGDDGEPEE